MKTTAPWTLLWLTLAAPGSGWAQAESESADLVLVDANVFTVDDDQVWAQAVAVKGDRILAVGSNAEVRRHLGRSTKLVRLKGRLVVPGFVDNRTNLRAAGARLFPADTEDGPSAAEQATELALAELRRWGVTSIQDVTPMAQLRVYQRLLREGKLTVRVWARPTLELVEHLTALGIETGFGNELLKIGGVEGDVDGSTRDGEALFFEPYRRDATNGDREVVPDERFAALLDQADHGRLAPSMQANGDRALHLLLESYQKLLASEPMWDRRPRVAHSQVIRPEDLSRFGELDLVAEVQPYHLMGDMLWLEERVGRDRAMWAYALRSLRENGAHISFGSDWPGDEDETASVNPLLGIYAAVTRKRLDGEPLGGWFVEQSLNASEAIEAYTLGSAFAAYEEDIKGSITVGKLADFAVLSEDITKIPTERIKDVDVIMTILGGKIIYQGPDS